jgi:hypothetical protein
MENEPKLRQHVLDFLAEHGAEGCILWDGLDAAVTGVAVRCGQPPLVVYDAEKVHDILVKTMSPDDVIEWIDYNIVGAWVGTTTPLLLRKGEFNDQKV